MIIVSQDRDNIVNFDNVVSVGIEDFDLNDKNCFQRITAETLGTSVFLGDYKSEERATEVLKQITKYYDRLKRCSVYAMGDSRFLFNEKSYYEMPKE